MFEGIKKALGIDYESKSRRECAAYVSRLSLPKSQIIIASPRYSPKFHCEILVSATDLLEWLEDHYSRCSLSFYAEALILWLRNANTKDEGVAYINSELHRAIDGYEETFIADGLAEVRCPNCRRSYASITQEVIDEEAGGSWHTGISIWRCPGGHKIYENKFEHHVLRPSAK